MHTPKLVEPCPSFTTTAGHDAGRLLARTLRQGTPSVWVIEHLLSQGDIVFELVPLSDAELSVLAGELRRHA